MSVVYLIVSSACSSCQAQFHCILLSRLQSKSLRNRILLSGIWNQNHKERPTFLEIITELEAINQSEFVAIQDTEVRIGSLRTLLIQS